MSINPFQDTEVPVANDKYEDEQKPFVDGIDNDVYGLDVDHSTKTTVGQPENYGRPVATKDANGRPTVVIPYDTIDTVSHEPGFLGRLAGHSSWKETVVTHHEADVRDMIKKP